MSAPSGGKKKLDRRMEAENVSQLKYMLELEQKRLREKTDVNLSLFIGVGGRIFTTSIPEELNPDQYRLLSTFKSNLSNLCKKLKGEDLEVSLERWKSGMAIVAAVGDNAFLASLLTKRANIDEMGPILEEIMTAATVLKHIFEEKSFKDEDMEDYPEDVKEELHQLSRQFFVDRFEHTRQYKKNMEILEFIKEKIQKTVGVGSVEEMTSVTFNKMGTSAPYMEDDMWPDFLDMIVEDHLKDTLGDIQAEEYKKQWRKELKKKLKGYL